MSIEIDIDRDLCIGSGTCVRLAPGAFALDDEEIATVQDAGAVGADKLRLAADACPSRAIAIGGQQGASVPDPGVSTGRTGRRARES